MHPLRTKYRLPNLFPMRDHDDTQRITHGEFFGLVEGLRYFFLGELMMVLHGSNVQSVEVAPYGIHRKCRSSMGMRIKRSTRDVSYANIEQRWSKMLRGKGSQTCIRKMDAPLQSVLAQLDILLELAGLVCDGALILRRYYLASPLCKAFNSASG